MKKIPLTQGKFAIVDDEDFDSLNRYSWCATERGGTFYAERGSKKNGRCCGYKMHRVIMKAPRGMIVHHINGDGLDNRKCNLRILTYRQHTQEHRDCVYFHSDNHAWVAQININHKTIHLGIFPEKRDAKQCYENACALLARGEVIKQKRGQPTSKHKGVYWHKGSKKWISRLQRNRKRLNLGRYENEIDAANAYEEARKGA